MLEQMQTRAELYETIGYHDYEALDATIVKTVVPKACRSVSEVHVNRRHVLMLLALAPLRAVAQGPNPTGPQPELPKERLVITTRDGIPHEFNVEMATTSDQQTVGLMFRPSVPAEGGMLFDWGDPARLADVDAQHDRAARHGVHQS